MPRMLKVCVEMLGVWVLFLDYYKTWKCFDFGMIALWALFFYFYISWIMYFGMCAIVKEGFYGVAFCVPSVVYFLNRSKSTTTKLI